LRSLLFNISVALACASPSFSAAPAGNTPPQVGFAIIKTSQVAATSIRWEVLEFTSDPFKGYAQSLDLYQDGAVVLVVTMPAPTTARCRTLWATSPAG